MVIRMTGLRLVICRGQMTSHLPLASGVARRSRGKKFICQELKGAMFYLQDHRWLVAGKNRLRGAVAGFLLI